MYKRSFDTFRAYRITFSEIRNPTERSLSNRDGLNLHYLVICHLVKASETFSQTFSRGEFPDCLKTAKVIPLFKPGSKTDINIYRSISLLPVLIEVLEKIMYNCLIKFLDKNDILYEKQFGFRYKHSTVDALIEITENIRSGTDEEITSIMLDLRKAFDTINHYRLLEKLSQSGVKGIVKKWFQSYLRNKKHALFVNDKWSNFEPINCGVPQGSILGPLLFIIYINNFPKCCPNVTTYLFADDANLIYSK